MIHSSMVQLKLECLKIAYSLVGERGYSDVMELADKIYDWVKSDLSNNLEKEMD